MLQVYHDGEFFLKLTGKLLVHGLFETFDRHVLYASVLVGVQTLEHIAVVTLNTEQPSGHQLSCLLKTLVLTKAHCDCLLTYAHQHTYHAL